MEKEAKSKKENTVEKNNDVESVADTSQPTKGTSDELLKVLRKTCKEPEGQFHGSIKTIHFLLDLSSAMFFIPSGLDIFSTFVLTLLKDNNPFCSDRSLVSIAIDIGDSTESVGTQFKTIGEVNASDIHRRIEEAEFEDDSDPSKITVDDLVRAKIREDVNKQRNKPSMFDEAREFVRNELKMEYTEFMNTPVFSDLAHIFH